MQRFIFRIRAATEFSIIKLLTLVHLGENLDDNDNDNSIVLGLSKKEIGSTMYIVTAKRKEKYICRLSYGIDDIFL